MAWREESIVSQRLEFVALASVEGANIRGLCRRFGISAPTAYKWLARHRAGEQLADRSRRPHRSPARSDEAIEAEVLRVRDRHPAWGARKIRAVLLARDRPAPSASTVHAILTRHGRIDPAESASHRACRRFEHDRPNALWQMDFKGHVPLQRGGRCHPLTIMDDHSRFSIALRACGNEREPTVRTHLIDVFRRYGLPECVLCDNGPPWGTTQGTLGYTQLSVWLLRLGVRVTHGRPHHPQTQGKAERFHRTLKSEVLSRAELRDMGRAQSAFDAWRAIYNLERPHDALALAVPASRYRASERSYPETLPEVEYGPGDTVRRVRPDGMIQHRGRLWYISGALCGERVGLRTTRIDGVLEVCYGPFEIARLDLRDSTRQATRRRPPRATPAPNAGEHV